MKMKYLQIDDGIGMFNNNAIPSSFKPISQYILSNETHNLTRIEAASDIIHKISASKNPSIEYSDHDEEPEEDANVCQNESSSMKKQLRRKDTTDIRTLLSLKI